MLNLCWSDMYIQAQWWINIWTHQCFGVVTFRRKRSTIVALQISITWSFCRAKLMKRFVTFLYNWITQSLNLSVRIIIEVYFLLIFYFCFFHLLLVILNRFFYKIHLLIFFASSRMVVKKLWGRSWEKR